MKKLLLFSAITLASLSGFAQSQFSLLKNLGNDTTSWITRSFELNNKLYFFTKAANVPGGKFWVTDGTVNGTTLVKNMPGDPSSVHILGQLGSKVLFGYFGGPPAGYELWETDGTSNGTQLLKDIYPGPTSSQITGGVLFNNKIYFLANDSVHGLEIWMTDGTANGTTMLKDINTTNLSWIGEMTVCAGKLFFRANNGTNGAELFVSDGTANGTVMVKDINPGSADAWPQMFMPLSNKLLFVASDGATQNELWESDGTLAGTTMVKAIRNRANQSGIISIFAKIGSQYYLAANDSVHGLELWKTDGTTAGTVMVKDINAGTANGLGQFPWERNGYILNGRLFFGANDGTNGMEPWISDGTVSGTQIITNFKPGDSSGFSYMQSVEVLNNKLVFVEYRDDYKSNPYVTDGTNAGTFLLRDIMGTTGFYLNLDSWYSLLAGNKLYISAQNDSGAQRIFETNGTVAGSFLNSLPITQQYVINNMIAFNNEAYIYVTYQNNSGVYQNEIFRTNTTPPTGLTKNISSNDLKVFPNPSSGHFSIQAGSVIKQVRLLDVTGKLVYHQSGNNNYQTVATDNMKPGIYFIQVETAEGTATVKHIIH